MSLQELEPALVQNYYGEEFIKFIEDNISYFRGPGDLSIVEFEPAIAYKYEGDFYGLLLHLGYPHHLHYLFMRLNKLESPVDYDGIATGILTYVGDMAASISQSLSTRIR